MKRNYVKPMIIFEDFSMSTNIAGDCSYLVMNPTEGTCGYVLTGEITIFTAEVQGCTHTQQEPAQIDELCYHVPIDSKELFNS